MNLQIIISGIGGQGVVFGSKVLFQAALLKGLKVIGSETHGMAQRGGSVVSHLKIGDFHSPLIRAGAADMIYAFEEAEFLRTLPFIKNRGICFVNTGRNILTGSEIEKYLIRKHVRVLPIDAGRIARELKAPLSVNLIMLGFSVPSNCLPFSRTDMEETIEKISPHGSSEMNLKAFRAGHKNWQSNLIK
ncbi:MAG: 2-oxoacid:acceptor oxidoreductase family protein [Planctomycetes bacterium]|nr:2-oxoacid:acceptor oxidoreductase family protein [Planctomycetota bacterium]